MMMLLVVAGLLRLLKAVVKTEGGSKKPRKLTIISPIPTVTHQHPPKANDLPADLVFELLQEQRVDGVINVNE